MLKFFKDYSLPIAMLIGAVGYKWICHLSFLTSTLIVLMLFLTFCKVDPRNLRMAKWHVWILLFQLLGSMALFFILRPVNVVLAQGVMICVLAPTATAAAVITGKLGGSVESLTTYTLLSNFAVAIVAPAVFPLIEQGSHFDFWHGFSTIIIKVFPLLIGPFVAAWLVRLLFPKLQAVLEKPRSLAFYLWVVALAIVTARTVRSLIEDSYNGYVAWLMAIGALLVCAMQFFIGKTIGGIYHDRISGGQALGQKNTILAIWMAQTYLNPLAAIGPGTYVLWQNIVNSWQLWLKQRGKVL